MNENLKLIIKTILFVLNIKKTDLCKKCSFSYTALNNYLVRHSQLKMENIKQVFDALDFDFTAAIMIASSDKTRLEIINNVLYELTINKRDN